MRRILFFMCAFLALPSVLGAQSAVRKDVPTDITSDRVRYFQQEQKVIFEGDVQVDRPDFNLESQKLTVFFEPREGEGANAQADSPAETGDIRKIIAEENVRLQSEGREGFCSRAVYDLKEEVITMEGNPRLVEGKNEIQGRIIRFYLAENRSEIIGGEEDRVKAIFYSSPEEQED